jgi:SAM-dependent methyltransferase
VPTEAEVFDYWEAGSCGTVHASSPPGSRTYYDEIETVRYRLEPFIHDFAGFAFWQGRRVLEIGVGAGTDFVNFARSGAVLTGVDLTPAAVDHARRRLALEDLTADLRVGSGEALPFADGTFDLVYSWGVIHHAEHPHRIVREIRRLLAPGGQARVMLYGRQSWAAYKLWARHALLVGRPRRSLSAVIATHLESPGTRAYTRREIELLFAGAGFEQVSIEGFPTPYDRRAAGPLAGWIRRDWFLGVIAS